MINIIQGRKRSKIQYIPGVVMLQEFSQISSIAFEFLLERRPQTLRGQYACNLSEQRIVMKSRYELV